MDPTAPLLFFDSGVGGLSVLGPTRELLPNAPIIYVADNAGFPYGERTETDIAARIPALLGQVVERFHPRLVSSPATRLDHRPRPGDPRSAARVALSRRQAGVRTVDISVIACSVPGDVRPLVDDSQRFAADCTVIRHCSPYLVELAEAKWPGGGRVEAVRAAAQPMFDAERGSEIDAVVLACTHFPLLDEELRAAFPGVALVDGGPGIARRIAYLTREQPWPAEPSPGIALFTGDPPNGPLLEALARFGLEDVGTL